MTVRKINTPTGLLALISFIPLALATLACGDLQQGHSVEAQLKNSQSSADRQVAMNLVSPQTGSVLSSERRLVWSEEFDGPEIDRSNWNYEVNGDGGGNNELQFYTDLPGNSFIEDGVLVIRAQKENYHGRQYTSARMTTRKKFDFTYGRVDVRARLPFGKGVWPAIWMIPTDSVYGGWPMSGEIDIMELLGQDPNRIYGTLHYGDAWPQNKHTGNSFTLPQGDFSQDFHVFSIEWEPNQIKWFVDGQHFSTRTPADLDLCKDGQRCPWRFDQDFFFILNVAVGGNWPGYPDASTVFPQTMKVDYVRVYQNTP